jgi:hypothetical protein
MKTFETWLLILQLASTLPLVGLIWTIQLVHYPLFAKVGVTGFVDYQHEHMRTIGPLVGPLMLVEVLTALVLLICRPDDGLAITGFALVVVVWASTAFIQVPCHRKLTSSFDSDAHRRLVRSNWIRTIAWSMRGVIAILMCPGWSFTN